MLNIVGDTKQKLENQVFSDKASKEDDDIYNKESGKSKSTYTICKLIEKPVVVF